MKRTLFLEAHSWQEILEGIRSERRGLRGDESDGCRRWWMNRLLDTDERFFELGTFAGLQMYDEAFGDSSRQRVTAGMGRIRNRLHLFVVTSSPEEGRYLFPADVRKVTRIQQMALENRLPIIYLVNASTHYVAADESLYPELDDFGRIAALSAQLARVRVPQVWIVCSPVSSRDVLLPLSADHIFLCGNAEVEAFSDLSSHSPPDKLPAEDVIGKIQALAETRDDSGINPFKKVDGKPPPRKAADVYDLMPLDTSQEYDTRRILETIFDRDSFLEYKAEYGQTLVCGYARLDGWSVGVVGNQKRHVRRPGHPIEVGGVIYPESADKAARFIMDCNQNRLPLIFFQDVNGFMVGREVEIAGIIRSGAKLVNVVANTVVPKITVIIGGSYGAGNYALCGKGYDPRFIFAWPTCRYAVMGGEQAARTLLALEVRQLEAAGQQIDHERLEELRTRIEARYAEQLDPHYAAARLWVDEVIEPHRTRHVLQRALEAVANNTEVPDFKTGVLQV